MIVPITVYLDSSDYSKMSDSRLADDAIVRSAKEFLRDSVSRGRVEVRFSLIHIIEGLHRNPESRSHAIARTELMSELSGSRVMRSMVDIVRLEIAGTAGAATCNDGTWYLPMPGFAREIQDSLAAGIMDATNDASQSRQYRRIAKKLFKKRKDAQKHLLSDPELIRRAAVNYGMSPRFVEKELFQLIVRSDKNPKKTEQAILAELFNPVSLVSHYLDRTDSEGKLRSSVTSAGERLLAAYQSFRIATQSLRDHPDIKKVSRFIADDWKLQAPTRQRQLLEKLYRSFAATHGSFPAGSSHPGMECFVRAADAWTWDVARPRSPRTPMQSDGGDMFHLFYLPYVDVWRGDAYSTGLAKRIRRDGDGIPVASLDQLEPTISRILSERQKQGT